jgi:hypothetical protein
VQPLALHWIVGRGRNPDGPEAERSGLRHQARLEIRQVRLIGHELACSC